MNSDDAMAAVLAEQVVAGTLAPIQCPCEFGKNGRYHLEELIGVGRSHVYRATDTLLSSGTFRAPVVVKIHARAGSDHEAFSGRMVEHPNVVRVVDRGVQDGSRYVVMEHLDGPTLGECEIPLPPRRAAKLIARLAGAVQAAHSAGVVHCDIKPENIIITADGEPKLLDFDLATSEANPDPRTRGNIAYMSPEQFAGDANALTPPSDVYALGGLLFLLLTGEMPHGPTYERIAATHRDKAPPRSPRIEPDLDAICLRALSRDRGARHESAAALGADLSNWLSLRPIEWTKPLARRRAMLWMRRERVKAVLAVACFLAADALVWIGVWTVAKQREAVRNADKRVAAINAKMRGHIGGLIKGVQSGEDIESRMTPALTWIDWLTDDPVIRPDGSIPAPPERIESLRMLVAAGEEAGRRAHTDVLIARYALAYFLVLDDHPAEAAQVIESLQRDWTPRLKPDEPVALSLAAVRACADHLLLTDSSEIKSSAARLKAMRSDLSGRAGCSPAVKLIQATLAPARKK